MSEVTNSVEEVFLKCNTSIVVHLLPKKKLQMFHQQLFLFELVCSPCKQFLFRQMTYLIYAADESIIRINFCSASLLWAKEIWPTTCHLHTPACKLTEMIEIRSCND